ncbi:hypothetical protein GGR50DRAFT_624872 [Xylaria sp. CBS 124048]|nr:hypothetical protein GGR50DRAFT_624872 [Xylaria sp. CBS 124048]
MWATAHVIRRSGAVPLASVSAIINGHSTSTSTSSPALLGYGLPTSTSLPCCAAHPVVLLGRLAYAAMFIDSGKRPGWPDRAPSKHAN